MIDMVSIDGKQVPLAILRGGLKGQVASLVRTILDITGETTILDWMSGKQPIIDRPQKDKPGYSLLDDLCFLDTHLPLLKHLVEDPNWRIRILENSGRWLWNIPTTLHFLTYSGKVVETLMPIKQVTCTKCGTELSDTKIQNICS
jgi:hypothetical protein